MSGPDHPATVEDATDAVSPAAGADGRDAGTAYLVRRPSRGDAEAFAELHAHVWRATYRGLMEDRVVDALSPEGFAPMWESIGAAYDEDRVPDDGRQFWVATTPDGDPVGFMMWGPPRDVDQPAPRQLWSLNVHPDHQGSGLARQLMDERFGSGPAYLWVARGNARAIAFYERHGFALDGTEAEDNHDGVVELRMVRDG